MSKKKNIIRKEFEKFKKRKGFFDYFGGKDKTREIHHNILICLGGTNDLENLKYINKGLHRLYHQLLLDGETELIMFSGKKPSNKKVVDEIGKGCLDKFLKELNKQDVINDLKSRSR